MRENGNRGNGTPEMPLVAVGWDTAERAVTEVAPVQKAKVSCWKIRFWGREGTGFGILNKSKFSVEIWWGDSLLG